MKIKTRWRNTVCPHFINKREDFNTEKFYISYFKFDFLTRYFYICLCININYEFDCSLQNEYYVEYKQ